MAEHKATWSISLDCTCPDCDEDFDIITSDSDFFNRSNIQPIEHDTMLSRDHEVTCPNCDHEFEVDFEY